MEPMPFAVIAERASLDDQGRLSLAGITDSIKVAGFPTAVDEFHLAAICELSSDELGRGKSVVTRLVDPDGAEIDVWRVRGHEIADTGRPRSYYRLLLHYTQVPFATAGTHEIRIKYDDDVPELCVPFELKEGIPYV